MSYQFGPAALRLQGIAARLLGWRPDHFWKATPAELIASLSRKDESLKGMSQDELKTMMERENGQN
jgi:Phage tail assembly chaperone protein, TAC